MHRLTALSATLQQLLACVFFLLVGTVAASGEGLPNRFAVLSSFGRDASLTSVLRQLESAESLPGPFSPEVDASAVVAGLPLWSFFPSTIWPWIVFENGQPIAMALSRPETAQGNWPSDRRVDAKNVRDPIRELTYKRLGRTLRFRAVFRGLSPMAKTYVSPSEYDRFVVSEGEILPAERTGCFRFNLKRSFALYYPGSLHPAGEENLGAYAKARLCFSVMDTSQISDGTEILHLIGDIDGVSASAEDAPETPMKRKVYAVGIPLSEAVATGAYVFARDVDGFHDESRLEDINRFAAILEESIARHDFDLAAQQVKSLNASLADLETGGMNWHWARRPTAEGVARYNELMEATELYRLAHLETQARVNEVRQQLLVLRSNFSGNIVKSMLKSAINWMNVVPTDPISGLAGYSDIAGALLLPQSLQGWKETSETDASILASQVSAIRHFEALETALAQRLDAITDARRALFDRIRENDEQRVLELDAALRRD